MCVSGKAGIPNRLIGSKDELNLPGQDWKGANSMPRLANGCRSINVPPFSALKAVSVDGGAVLHLTVIIYLEFMSKTEQGKGSVLGRQPARSLEVDGVVKVTPLVDASGGGNK